jgi:beta-lactamase regulating signal transducer with metallopeptidase domain
VNALLDAPVLGLGADAALKGFLVLLAALAATTLMRRASAASRHLVWLAALTGVLLLPLAAAVVPAWRALPQPSALIPPATLFAGARTSAASPAGVADAASPALQAAEPVSLIKSNGVVAAPRDASAAPAPRVERPAEAGAGGALSWKQVAMLVWLVGAAILLVRLLGGLLAVLRMERRASELDDERWTMLTDRLSRRMRLGRIVRLLRGPTSAVPMTWGAFRPVILLPAEADAWDEDRRAAVLAHELAHVRRWDALTQWIAHLAVALFWFYPLVWVAARRVREEREHACDDAVLAVGTRATDYADHLLTIVRALGSAPGPAAALAMARRTHFEGRLRAILDSATPRGPVSRTLTVATSIFALTFIVPLAALRASEGAPETEDVEPRSIEGRARALGTDAARRDFLLRLVGDLALPPMALGEVARASGGIGSDAARAPVLDALLERDDLGASALALAIESAAGMRAQTALAAFLRDVADARPVADGLVCEAFFGALDRLRDPRDLRPVLETVVGQPGLDVAVLEEALRVATRLDDASLRVVLATAISAQPVKGQARPAYLQAARRIRDAAWRAEALAALDAEDAALAKRTAAIDSIPADSAVHVVGGNPEWKVQMLARQAELEYHEEQPDSAFLRLDARNARMSWRDGASEMDLHAGGYVHVRETRDGVETEVQLREDGRGGVIRVFRVAGAVRPWGAEAQHWYERVNQHLYEHLK